MIRIAQKLFCTDIPIGFHTIQIVKVRLGGGVKKWKDRKLWENGKYLVFPRVCLVGGMEKWEDENLFYLVEKKSGKIEKVVYIN